MVLFFLVYMVLLINCSAIGIHKINSGLLSELNDFELKLLKDFVRGKGTATVSRLPFDDLFKEADEFDNFGEPIQAPPKSLFTTSPSGSGLFSIDALKPQVALSAEDDNNFLTLTRVIKPHNHQTNSKFEPSRGRLSVPEIKPTFSTRIRPRIAAAPSTKIVSSEPDKETFKEFALILQQLIDVRKATVTSTTIAPTTSSHPTLLIAPQKPSIRRQNSSKTFPSSIQAVTTVRGDRISQKRPFHPFMNRGLSIFPKPGDIFEPLDQKNQSGNDEEEDWELKMHELSEQLHSLLVQIKEAKLKSARSEIKKLKPKITIIRNGSAEQTSDNEYLFVSSITLIQDLGMNILVDTGLGTDINARTEFLKSLNNIGLSPPQIDIVVSTHGHPDHNGGVADFPDAIHYHGWYVHHHNVFNLSRLFEADRQFLTENIYLIKTPGHTSEDISVIVKNAERYGNVSVTGDVFIRSEDTDHPMMWRPLSFNETQQSISRRYLLCTSDFLVPGHGAGFFVSRQMRNKFQCE